MADFECVFLLLEITKFAAQFQINPKCKDNVYFKENLTFIRGQVNFHERIFFLMYVFIAGLIKLENFQNSWQSKGVSCKKVCMDSQFQRTLVIDN